jgi:putative NADPH-quinone reductase
MMANRNNANSRHALVVVAHPDRQSLNHAMARAVYDLFAEQGYVSILRDLHAEGFDPVLNIDEARGRPTTDKLVQQHIALLTRSEVIAVVHPNFWGAPPAMMKGWMDRVFAPGAAYAFEKGVDRGDVPRGLLKTRAALIINTSNTDEIREGEVFGDPLDRIWRSCLLEYCGIARVERLVFRIVAVSDPAQRASWIAQAKDLARQLS